MIIIETTTSAGVYRVAFRTYPNSWHLADTFRVYRCPVTGEETEVLTDAPEAVYLSLPSPRGYEWGDTEHTWFQRQP